jgi:hypothetical protein
MNNIRNRRTFDGRNPKGKKSAQPDSTLGSNNIWKTYIRLNRPLKKDTHESVTWSKVNQKRTLEQYAWCFLISVFCPCSVARLHTATGPRTHRGSGETCFFFDQTKPQKPDCPMRNKRIFPIVSSQSTGTECGAKELLERFLA